MKKYVLVGCGARGIISWAVPLVKSYSDVGALCGVYDLNEKRAKLVSEYVGKEIPVYNDFDKMLEAIKPDAVIITTKDSDHDTYAIKAMKAGCDVICEKPLTTTFEKAVNIWKTQQETGKDVIVTFNLRFAPLYKRIKEIVNEGTIGKVLSVHFEWLLDTNHGADYFRRWHREIKNSGSLLIHKSSHHFDLVNWFLEEDPAEVSAFGTRRFYGPTREERSERCLDCPYSKECKFYMDLSSIENYRKIYLECEDADGYFRDKCVFSDEIDICDSMSVSVKYSGGAVMSYSLTAHSPYEGIRLVLNGTDGRLELQHGYVHGTGFSTYNLGQSVKIYNRKGETIDMKIPEARGDHGGADDMIRDRIFRDKNAPDQLHQMADTYAGLMSVGIGMAANLSMKEERKVKLSEFFGDIKRK